ncbi:MAG: rhomboid family intramembrane serine protease [Gemmatimonadota bacterium]|nr:MAG: rhomboid family intramembrane serine protease [Gemmatimonadota bacterium]
MGYSGGRGIPTFSFQLTPVVKKLIIVTVGVFIVSRLVGDGLVESLFAFQPRKVLLQPWGAVTYMFVHGDLMHLAGNMIVLFFFGPPLERRWGSREFTKYYLICGLGGVGLSFIFASSSAIIGASAAIYGLMLAFAMIWPKAPIYVWGIFPVQARWLVAFFFLLAFSSAFGAAGGGIAYFAHLGGLVTGFIYLKSDWKVSGKLQRFANAAGTKARRLAIVRIEDTSRASARKAGSTDASRRNERATLDAVDQVLDKISAEGMSSLTPDERALLDEVSRRQRTN